MKYKLKEIFDLQMGKTPARNNDKYWNTKDYKWISIADLTSTDKYINNTKEYISRSAVKESGIKIIPANTVVMSFKLSIGKTAILAEDMCSNEAIMAFHDKHVVELLPEYTYYLIKAKNWNGGSNRAVMGQTLNKATLSEIEVDVHTIDEQRKIVELLNLLGKIIYKRNTQLSKLVDILSARFVEMFGDPSLNNKGYPIRSLPEIAEYWNGLTYRPEDISDDGTVVLRSGNIQNTQLDFEDIVRVKCSIGEKKYVKDNDILMCSRNGSARLVGKVALIKNLKEPMSFGAFMMNIRSRYYPYLMVYFQMPIFRAQITMGATTTINQITVRMLDNIKLPVPEKGDIEIFATFVNQVNKSKVEVQKALDKAQLLFDSLMQKYFG